MQAAEPDFAALTVAQECVRALQQLHACGLQVRVRRHAVPAGAIGATRSLSPSSGL